MKSNTHELVPVSDAINQICRFWPEHAPSARELMRFLEQQSCWNQLQGWEEQSDVEIYAALVARSQLKGQVVVISDLSYRRDLGAFAVDAEDLPAFVSSFSATFGECLFNGDVLIAQREQQQLWVFHHEGAFAFFSALQNTATYPCAAMTSRSQ